MHKKNVLITIIIKLFALFLLSGCSNESTKAFQAMNTLMTVRSFGLKSEKANKAVQKRISELEETISTTRTTSEIFVLNHSNDGKGIFSKDASILLDFSLSMAKKTNGALNPCLYPITTAWGFTTENFRVPPQTEIDSLLPLTDFTKVQTIKAESQGKKTAVVSVILPQFNRKNMQLDFGAVGKGYAGDEAIKILKSCGIKSAILDLGGNVQVLGGKKSSDGSVSDWNIGVKSPWGGEPAGGVKIRDKCVITSGGYERYFEDENGKRYIHIMDSKTGRPAEPDVASVTIVADTGIYGDALSTALFVMGKEKAIEFWRTYNDFEMIIIIDQDSIAFTEGLKDSFKLLQPFKNIQIINH